MTDEPDDDDVPILRDLVRHGRKRPPDTQAQSGPPGLSSDEIEAIAARVVAEHVPMMEQAVARAIREALAKPVMSRDATPDDATPDDADRDDTDLGDANPGGSGTGRA